MSDDVTPIVVLSRLMSLIEDRRRSRPAGSYTTRLFDGGVPKINSKVVEESAEVVEAATEPGEAGRQHLIRETGDLLYHLLVLLAEREITLEEVAGELARREGMSGLEEKASRTPKP